MRWSIALLMSLFTAVPATAAATPWVELAPDARVRLIASEAWSGEGKTYLALEVDLPPNTKTYWRVPGETGIPTEIDFSGSTGISGHSVAWPYPQIEQQQGYTDFVYYGPTVIPIEISVTSDRPVVDASVMMGICSDICVPATAEFSLDLRIGAADVGNDLRIAQALALAPIAWSTTPEPIGEVTLEDGGEGLEILIDPEIVDPASVIAAAEAEGYLLGAPQKSPEPGVIRLPLLGRGGAAGLKGSSVQLIFMTRNGPYEVSRQIAP